ncbi:MAG: DUF2855 family protein [bacterium]|nr:hypothetical protein [Deltaproteobacteria bacterium]MCP4908290.1 DUF2855 family protein [bacterium]
MTRRPQPKARSIPRSTATIFTIVVSSESAPISALSDGQILFKVDRFALTSNNFPYAAAGDLLNYWGFFPRPDRWGRIPAMAFGDVIDSHHSDVEVGARCFGFFPMSRTS